MAPNDMSFSSLSDDWSVILQSFSPKLKKDLVRRICEIFELDKKDAEQALSNMPLILLDNLSFGMAARIKNFFQKLGAVVETTNHDMIKKNCFQVLWPETPDLSFFLKEEAKLPVHETKSDVPPQKQPESNFKPVVPPTEETPSVVVRASQPDTEPVEPVMPYTPSEKSADASDQESGLPHPPKVNEGWEKRAKELSEKLGKFQEEKKKVDEDIVLKAVEKVQTDFSRRHEPESAPKEDPVEMETPRQEETQVPAVPAMPEGIDWRAKAMLLSDRVRTLEQDLATTKEDLVKEVEMWRSKTSFAEGRVRELEAVSAQKAQELEATLAQKAHEIEQMTREKEHLSLQSGQTDDLASQLETLRNSLAEKDQSLLALQDHLKEWMEKAQAGANAVEEKERKLAELQGQMGELMEKVQASAGEFEEKGRSLAELQGQVNELMGKVQSDASEFEKKDRSLAELQGQVNELVGKVQTSTSAIEERESALRELQGQAREWMSKAQASEGLIEEKERALNDLREQARELAEKVQMVERVAAEKDNAVGVVQKQLELIQNREKELLQKVESLQNSVTTAEKDLRVREESLKARDEALASFETQVAKLVATIQGLESMRQEHAQFSQERATIRGDYEAKILDLESRTSKIEDDHRRYRSRVDRKIAAATRELGEWMRGIDALRQGLQKLVVFLGSESAVPESGKKTLFRSSFNRTENSNPPEKT